MTRKDKLKEYRLDLGLSIRKMAELIGKSHYWIYVRESGKVALKDDKLKEIKEVYKMTDKFYKELLNLPIEQDISKQGDMNNKKYISAFWYLDDFVLKADLNVGQLKLDAYRADLQDLEVRKELERLYWEGV